MQANPRAFMIWLTLAFVTAMTFAAGVTTWWIWLAVLGVYTVFASAY